MGYGSRALMLLRRYYRLEIPCVEEAERPAEAIEAVQESDLDLLEEVIGEQLSLGVCLLTIGE